MERPALLVAAVHLHGAVHLQLLSLVPLPAPGGPMIEGTEVRCAKGAIATGPAEGARAGARVFESGGNAMDAVAAASLACAVIEPQACDLGGYVAAGVVLDGKTGQIWSLDANSVAPQAAREDMYETLPPEPGKRGINELEYGCSVR